MVLAICSVFRQSLAKAASSLKPNSNAHLRGRKSLLDSVTSEDKRLLINGKKFTADDARWRQSGVVSALAVVMYWGIASHAYTSSPFLAYAETISRCTSVADTVNFQLALRHVIMDFTEPP